MKLFNQGLIEILNPCCKGEEIHFIGLGRFDFQFSFGDMRRFQNTLKVLFKLKGNDYTWEGGPNDIPVWGLVGQVPQKFSLDSPKILTMHLKSGDKVLMYTEQSQYENCLIEFLTKDNTLSTQIF